MSNFVRESFYVDPPKSNAPVKEWKEWQKKDRAKAIKARRAFIHQYIPGESLQIMQNTIVRKINGVWKQTAAVGLTGSVENGSVGLEPITDARQEQSYDQAQFVVRNRGVSHVRSATDRRKARRMRRMMKRRGQI